VHATPAGAIADLLPANYERLAVACPMSGIQLPIQKRIDAFGFVHRLGTRLEEILFVTESGEKLSSSDRIGRVSKPCVNGVSRAASGTLNEHA
jgi:hypothetical protein